jgi:hypothetical protein
MQHEGVDHRNARHHKTSYGDIERRVRTAFPKRDDGPVALQYLNELRTQMQDISKSSRQNVLLLLLTAAAFELLNRAAVANAEIGPFQIKDLSLIQKVLPVIFAYFIYYAFVLGARYLYSMRVADEITRTFQPALSDAILDRLLYPQGSPLFGPLLWHKSNSSMYRLTTAFTRVLRIGSVVSPILIEIYAFSSLRDRFGLNDVVVAFSLIFSLGFLAFSALILLTSLRDGLVPLTKMLESH